MKSGFAILWENVRIAVLAALILLGFISFLHFTSKTSFPKNFVAPQMQSEQFKIVDWRLLREMNSQSGEASEALKALDGKRIQIPGFLVPLEDNQNKISEFLLVPSPQACIHVPPPPPNQMIYVKMKTPIQFDWGYRAYWIMGILSLKTVQSPYGAVSFEMLGDSIKPFNFKKQEF